ncbi:MAG: chromosomal replication initiator protein DnaA [Candidatus Liptonbacteria bacterium]|nr:chromosomal replication initiator protein DnaA [Candidatus Liptonbacteria bacterium]
MNYDELWQTVLVELEIQISRPNFLTWLKNSSFVQNKDGEILIALPNHFAKEWVEAKYHKFILGSLRTKDSSIKKVGYIVDRNIFKKESSPPAETVLAKAQPNKDQLSFLEEMKIDPESGLNPRYNVNSFVVGSNNELAYAASLAVIESVGKKYNPFFIYGGTGLGKTHLLQAIGNEIKNLSKGKIKIKYVSSEKFTNDVIWAIRNKRMEDVKKNYRTTDVLLIDDIQFIGGKEKTEEEFFHTFNTLYENNKQIVLSSDRPPRAIPILEERLRSRFEGGMIADITQPDYETRMAIIKVKLQEMNESLPDEVIILAAKKIQRNIRELEGAINKIIFYKNRKNNLFDIGQAEKIINELTEQSAINITPTQIIKTVASFHEISPADLTSKTRRKEIVEPRQITIYFLRELLNLSYPYIAEKIGKRDHTTAIYSYEKINRLIKKDQGFQQKIMIIKEMINKSNNL